MEKHYENEENLEIDYPMEEAVAEQFNNNKNNFQILSVLQNKS